MVPEQFHIQTFFRVFRLLQPAADAGGDLFHRMPDAQEGEWRHGDFTAPVDAAQRDVFPGHQPVFHTILERPGQKVVVVEENRTAVRMLFQEFRYSGIPLLSHVQPGTRTVERMDRIIENMSGHIPRQGFQPVDTGETGPVGHRMKNELETGPLFGREHIPQRAESTAEGETDPRSKIVEVVKTFCTAAADEIEDFPVVLDMSQYHESADAPRKQIADLLQIACNGVCTAAREIYNDSVLRWNTEIFALWAKKFVAAKAGYTTRIPFIASAEIKAKSESVLF